METKVALRYSGPAVDSGAMDVYEASANMVAFSDFVALLAKQSYGESVQTRASVAGFGRGSFVTDLVFDVGGVTSAIFSSISPKDLWWMLKEALGLWKHLKGSPPSKVEYEGQTAIVHNNYGEVKQVNIGSLTVVFSEKGAESAQQFVQKALDKPGMDAIEIASDAGLIERVSQQESRYFVPVAPNETVTDTTFKMALILESVVFKQDNKWRFSDGQQSFYATMEDKEFLAQIDAGEAFRKGDILRALVRISQQQSGMKLTAERSIVKVLEHKPAPKQLLL